jgi:PiT family inorganic phosphate transporter
MSFLLDGSVSAGLLVIVVLGLLLALGFEMVNGFHDTANAVATVIYTHSLTPTQAVVWSGIWNFLGVVSSSGAVAFAIVALLPLELVLHVGSGAGMAMVFSLLLSALLWNVATWYRGLPASSSHALIGSIVGVGMANSLINGHGFGEGVNWGKVEETFVALVTSPLIGFVFAALLLLLARRVIRDPRLYRAPDGPTPPPLWIRGLLVLTCTGVSFAHGSNDGQKGMGLIMLVLVALLPAAFALHLATGPDALARVVAVSRAAQPVFEAGAGAVRVDNGDDADRHVARFLTTQQLEPVTMASLAFANGRIARTVSGVSSLRDLRPGARSRLRRDVYMVDTAATKLLRVGLAGEADAATLTRLRAELQPLTDYIPLWVKIAVALALGLGTMVGWKRIVVTLGEKIGKSHLTYAQGASAELVGAATIGMADVIGMPVSTTHILSSGIAGAMAADRTRLQHDTLRNIILAWVLTIPACMLLGSMLFAASLFVILRLPG